MNGRKNFAIVIVAAGKSRRFGDHVGLKKPFAPLSHKPVWLYSVECFVQREDVRQMIVVVAPDEIEWFCCFYASEIDRYQIQVLSGGQERVDSVACALTAIEESIDFIAVHDAARPCLGKEQLDLVCEKARETGAAILAVPVIGTVKRVRDGRIVETVSRTELWEAQTPQVFQREILFDAYAGRGDSVPTDDAELVENAGYDVCVVLGSRQNLKITNQADLSLAEKILFSENNHFRGDMREK